MDICSAYGKAGSRLNSGNDGFLNLKGNVVYRIVEFYDDLNIESDLFIYHLYLYAL